MSEQKPTRWYWKALVDGWFIWGVWIHQLWFVGVSRRFQAMKLTITIPDEHVSNMNGYRLSEFASWAARNIEYNIGCEDIRETTGRVFRNGVPVATWSITGLAERETR